MCSIIPKKSKLKILIQNIKALSKDDFVGLDDFENIISVLYDDIDYSINRLRSRLDKIEYDQLK